MYKSIKTITDYLLAFLGLILFSPFIVIYSLLIVFLYQTNPIYLQKRSIDGIKFITIYKLKTIKNNTVIQNIENTSFYRIVTEDSFYFLGRFLRMAGFDEIPQLLNVLKGEMSIIGPRPLMSGDIELIERNYPLLFAKRKLLKSKPGISGLWQVNKSLKTNFNEMIELDLYYEEKAGILTDLKLLQKTVINMLTISHIDSLQCLLTETNIKAQKKEYI